MAHTATARGARTARARRIKRTSPSKPKGSGLERFRGFLKGGGPGANSYVVLLGLDAFEPQELLSSVEQGLPYGAFERLLANTEEGEPRRLLGHLVEYHQREARPQWWAWFR